MNKTSTGSSVTMSVRLTMTEEYDTDFKVTPESVIEKIDELNKDGMISNYEGWELTDKMWDIVTNEDSLYSYREHQLDYYSEYPTRDEYYEVEEEVIMDIIENLTYKNPKHPDQDTLITESELLKDMSKVEGK